MSMRSCGQTPADGGIHEPTIDSKEEEELVDKGSVREVGMGTNREVREVGTNREVREVREVGTNREVREVGTNREVREVREVGTNREVREVREVGTNREVREVGTNREVREVREVGTNREVREVGTNREVREVREVGTNREVREVREVGTNREVREVGTNKEVGTNREVREVGTNKEVGTNREVREVGMGTNREVAMGPVKGLVIREREAELLSLMKSGIDRKPHSGGRGRVLTDQQEWALVEMVRARNDIRLSEIKQAPEENNDTFANVASISLPTVGRILNRHQRALTWPKLVAVDGTSSVNEPLSKYLDNVEETSPCAQLSLKMVS
ncbi:unnamed protein product [Leuciscus chuanchicus]